MLLMLSRIRSSPRLRRRLGWTAGVLVAASAAAVTIALLPTGKPPPPDRLTAGPTVRAEREVRLTPAMRRGINATLDRFVPAAVGRRDPAFAWSVAGPGLRGGTTRRDWVAGNLPVQPFPVGGTRFHSWRPLYVYRDRVGFDLLLHPRKTARVGPIAVSIDVIRRGDSWLVDSFYTTAVFNDPDEPAWVAGQPDYGADGTTAEATYTRPKFAESRLSPAWFALPVGLFAGAVLAVAAYALAVVRRSRRAEAAHAAAVRARAS
jgi:hypothetical protein